MHAREGQADDQAAEGAVARLAGGHAEDAGDEDEGQDDLDQQARNRVAAHTGEAVGAETTGHIRHAAELKDDRQDGRADQRADALGDDVAADVLLVHTAGHEHAEGDGGVDVAAGDVADGVSHGDDGQAEGQGGEDVAAAGGCVTAHQHGGTAPEHDQCAGADRFCDKFFHRESPSFLLCPHHTLLLHKKQELVLCKSKVKII